MTTLYPNLCYNEVCYRGTVLYSLYLSPTSIPKMGFNRALQLKNASQCWQSH